MSVGGTGECLAIEGSTTGAVFEAYLVQVFLVPSLEPGQVMVRDNLSAHPGTFGAHHGSDNPRHLQSYDPRHGTQAAEVMEDVLAWRVGVNKGWMKSLGLRRSHVLPASQHLLRVIPKGFEPLTFAMRSQSPIVTGIRRCSESLQNSVLSL
jgi:hypothetical protein